MRYEKYAAFARAQDIQGICEPFLEALGLNFFQYCKSFSDGGWMVVNGNRQWLQDYFEREFYRTSNFRGAPEDYPEQYLFSSSLTEGHEIAVFAKKQYGVGDCLTIRHFTEDGVEFFIFGAPVERTDSVQFFLNHMDKLQQFMLYFFDRARQALSHIAMEKLYLPYDNFPHKEISGDGMANVKKLFNLKRFYFDSKQYLTNKEVECLRWVGQGKSLTEVAMILGNSERTVESHVSHAKEKLQCYKMTQLVLRARELGFI